ncbi:MAG TPA: enoyl-CoA hydratase/isomerase family protein [Paenalcaligenes sp.]|nr:enoyl-CoA hydratase/isomerase family protein [Paenalcaligenes sp.]
MAIDIVTRPLAQTGLSFGLITLNRPEALNSLNLQMVSQLLVQLEQWQHNAHIAFVVLSAQGHKAFCAGGDVSALYHALDAKPLDVHDSSHGVYQFFQTEYQLNGLIHHYAKPIVVLGHGVLMGGGVGLFMGASHRVVFDNTRFAMPEVAIGLYPDVAGTWMLSRLPGGVGEYLAVTGSQLSAHDCGFLGLADIYMAARNHETVLDDISSMNYDVSRDAAQNLDAVFSHHNQAWNFHCSAVYEQFGLLRTLASCRSALELEHCVEQFVQVDPNNAYLKQGLQQLRYASPLAKAITWQLLQINRRHSVLQTLERDLWVSLQCCANGDVSEGVRALLIDKDRQPNWIEQSEVTESLIQAFCQPDWAGKHGTNL